MSTNLCAELILTFLLVSTDVVFKKLILIGENWPYVKSIKNILKVLSLV